MKYQSLCRNANRERVPSESTLGSHWRRPSVALPRRHRDLLRCPSRGGCAGKSAHKRRLLDPLLCKVCTFSRTFSLTIVSSRKLIVPIPLTSEEWEPHRGPLRKGESRAREDDPGAASLADIKVKGMTYILGTSKPLSSGVWAHFGSTSVPTRGGWGCKIPSQEQRRRSKTPGVHKEPNTGAAT